MKRGFGIIALMWMLILSGCNSNQPPEQNQYVEKLNHPPQEPNRLPLEELETKITDQESLVLNRQITFTYQKTNHVVPLKDLGVSTNASELVEQVRHNPDIQVDDLDLTLYLNEKTAAARIKEIARKLNSQPKDAGYKVKSNNTMEIIPHAIGKEVNEQKAIIDFKQALQNKDSVVALEVKEKQPKITTEQIAAQKIEGLIASFSTYYPTNNKSRTENLKKATKALDSKLIKPGEVFSFNTAVGPRTEKTGYQEALIIIDNEYVPGVGGGVCQVSSTLYNLALLADLQIVERHRHQFAIPYLPPGRDATVVYDRTDLRFKNNTGGLILLRTQAKGGVLKMTLYGKKTNKKVEIQTVVEATKPYKTERRYDSSLAPGTSKKEQGGVKGYKSVTYRIVKIANKIVRKEQISKDVYKPANKIIKVGPSKSRGGPAE